MTEPCVSPVVYVWCAGNQRMSRGEWMLLTTECIWPCHSVEVYFLHTQYVCSVSHFASLHYPQVRTWATLPELSICKGRAHTKCPLVSDTGNLSCSVSQQSWQYRQNCLLRLWQLPTVLGCRNKEREDLYLGCLQNDEGQITHGTIGAVSCVKSVNQKWLSCLGCSVSSVCYCKQVHLKFDINPYDPAILRQLILCGGEHSQQTLTESRRPTLAWLEESSSCSDLPKLEGDRWALFIQRNL